MEKVPQIVRERLRVATPLANHPDADVLTAFAERSLPDLERAIVMEHLARCGDCREVVALALPESVPVTSEVAPSGGGWFAWPVLRWGFALAGVAVIASVGVMQYRRQSAPTMAQQGVAKFASVAKNEVATSPPVASDKESTPAVAGKQEQKAPSVSSARSDANGPAFRLKKSDRDEAPASGPLASATGATAGMRVGLLPHGPKLANQNQLNQWQTQNSGNAFVGAAPSSQPPAAAPAPQAQGQLVADSRLPAAAQSANVEVAASAPAIEADKLDLQSQPLSNQSANDGYGEAKVEKTKPAETVVTIGGPTKVLANATPSNGRQFDYLSASPRWAITSYGTLQRSYDQGASWQDVPVKGTPGGATGGMRMASAAATPERTAGLAKTKDTAKPSVALDAPIQFRAVSAVGNDVWAGGSAGKLYHSSDAGSHWVQVIPSSGSMSLTGDIVGLEFSDSQHGRITTSTREVWLTSDGQSWQKQ